MHSTNFSQFGGKLFDEIAKKLQLLRASRYWPNSPAKLWGSIGGAFLLLLIIMPFRDFLSLLVVVGALAGALTLWKPWEHNSLIHPTIFTPRWLILIHTDSANNKRRSLQVRPLAFNWFWKLIFYPKQT